MELTNASMWVPALEKGGSFCSHHYGRHILDFDILAVDRYPHLFEHADHRLYGKGGLLPVTGAIKADNQPIPNQLIGAYAFDVGDYLLFSPPRHVAPPLPIALKWGGLPKQFCIF